ncbi:hypothetical protein KIH27_01995 [Mycobacterium sp. M1]|uniref:Uncharacterized protein n=1 Tax=Mycolicibacter acidiphilus TaxID=2835306 RepID=A0ABS5RDJ7_9MYCO|nr:hypothetical protein [Mycolicibacter acidiphilus]MBS9532357.1 hypothetical protein [Mycolicibacter acidiphilus]
MKSITRRVRGLSAVAVLGVVAPLIAPAPAYAAIPIVFELTGTFTEGVLVSYIGADGQPEVTTVGLPWSTAFDYNGDARSLTFTGSHPGDAPGSITCRVSVNGRTIVSHTNNVPAPAVKGATCNIVNLGKGYIGN